MKKILKPKFKVQNKFSVGDLVTDGKRKSVFTITDISKDGVYAHIECSIDRIVDVLLLSELYLDQKASVYPVI